MDGWKYRIVDLVSYNLVYTPNLHHGMLHGQEGLEIDNLSIFLIPDMFLKDILYT